MILSTCSTKVIIRERKTPARKERGWMDDEKRKEKGILSQQTSAVLDTMIKEEADCYCP